MLTDKDPFWLLHEDDRATVVTEARHLWFKLRKDDPAIKYSECFEALRHVGAMLAEARRQEQALDMGTRIRELDAIELAQRVFGG